MIEPICDKKKLPINSRKASYLFIYLFILAVKLAINLDELADQPDEEKTNRFLTHFLDINCGGVYEDGTGTISSPGFPNGYVDNLDCTWLIYRTKETAEFIFVDFATESNYDIAIITSGR